MIYINLKNGVNYYNAQVLIVFAVEAEELKRVSSVLNSQYNEKIRASKPKSKKKAAGKARLNVGQGAIAVSNG